MTQRFAFNCLSEPDIGLTFEISNFEVQNYCGTTISAIDLQQLKAH